MNRLQKLLVTFTVIASIAGIIWFLCSFVQREEYDEICESLHN